MSRTYRRNSPNNYQALKRNKELRKKKKSKERHKELIDKTKERYDGEDTQDYTTE